ncbi:hypothetical protein N2152v2_006004 [Parachlorella kessleri]
MEAAQDRRKRLKALSQEAGAQGDFDGGEGAGAGPLVNPFADDGVAADTTSGPFNFYSDPLGSMERSRLAQQRRAEQQQAQRAVQPQQPPAPTVTPSQPQLGPTGAPAAGGQPIPPPFQQQQQPQHVGRSPWASGGPPRPQPHWQQQQWQSVPQQQWGQPYAQQPYPPQPPLPPPGPGGYQGLPAPPAYQQQPWRPPPPGMPPMMRPPGGPGSMQGRVGRGGQQHQHQQPGGRGRGRGYPSGGSNSSAGRGRGGAGSRGAEAFFSPSMLENPWADLERRLGVGSAVSLAAKQQQEQQDPGQQPDGLLSSEADAEAAALGKSSEGRLAAEGFVDRPWH